MPPARRVIRESHPPSMGRQQQQQQHFHSAHGESGDGRVRLQGDVFGDPKAGQEKIKEATFEVDPQHLIETIAAVPDESVQNFNPYDDETMPSPSPSTPTMPDDDDDDILPSFGASTLVG